MPRRPFGHQYSTIGFNHVGKVAILNEINEQVRRGHRFQVSPGAPGTVALGFTFEECAYHLKVIRDKPTSSYKWGAFPGVAAVSDKYRVVHEINRAGSMLDNVMYFNLRLDRDMFDPALLDEICRQAAGSVQVDQDGVYLRQLIVQLKIVPLPVFLETADEDATRRDGQPRALHSQQCRHQYFQQGFGFQKLRSRQVRPGLPLRLRRGRKTDRREDPHQYRP
jgi:isocitrate dehydrogenase kinase/phosphatase